MKPMKRIKEILNIRGEGSPSSLSPDRLAQINAICLDAEVSLKFIEAGLLGAKTDQRMLRQVGESARYIRDTNPEQEPPGY